MHERSLVMALLRQAEEIRLEHHADRIREIRVEVGPLSGVEPLLLKSAFDELTGRDAGGGRDASGRLEAAGGLEAATEINGAPTTRLVVDEVPLLARCIACANDFEVLEFNFRCSRCGGRIRVTGGDSLELVSVSLQSEEPADKRAS